MPMSADITNAETSLAKNHKQEIDTKLRELCAAMNVALDDGFVTSFQLSQQAGDNRFFIAALVLAKHF